MINTCAALIHMTVYSITYTDSYSDGNGRFCTMFMVTMSDRIWAWIGKPSKTTLPTSTY